MDSRLFLTNTDTTIGFISKSKKTLDIAKNRAPKKKYITALSSLKSLNKRVPQKFRERVRRANKSTFVLNKEFSFRVIKDSSHLLLIDRLGGYAYTTSANKSKESFNYDYAINRANITIYPLEYKDLISKIYKIGKVKIKRIR